MALAFGAWVEMRQRLASYNAVASAPWTEAWKRFLETVSATGSSAMPPPDWREAFAKWSEISNEELIRNQRTDGFLQAQKQLLQAGLQLRSRQDDVAEAASSDVRPADPQGFRRCDASIDGGARSARSAVRCATRGPKTHDE